jgi:hypothetical protein
VTTLKWLCPCPTYTGEHVEVGHYNICGAALPCEEHDVTDAAYGQVLYGHTFYQIIEDEKPKKRKGK